MKNRCSGIGSAATLGVLLGAVAGGCVLVIDGDGRGDDWSWSDLDNGRSGRPRMGVELASLTQTTAAQCNTDPDHGCAILGVTHGSPAERAGLQACDVVTAIDGESGANESDLRRAIRAKEWGDAVTLSIVRRGRPMDVTVLLEREVEIDHGDPNY